MVKQINLKIYGRVQKVLFRDSARRKARKLELTGWVKNEDDNTVKIIAEGEEENLKEFIKWCYNGPIMAKVDKVEIKWQNKIDKFKDFIIKY